MKKVVTSLFIIISVITVAVFVYVYAGDQNQQLISPLSLTPVNVEKPLDKYSLPRLSVTKFEPQPITIETVIDETDTYTSHVFSFSVDDKRVTGQLNLPNQLKPDEIAPTIIMLRGYIDPETYTTGDGTRNAAAYYASRGYSTIAPDFLGYGGSDDPDIDPIAARVKRPATVLQLLANLSQMPSVDTNNLFMWGHSNGGQIALTVLESIGQSPYWSGKTIPTTLWAPVSKPFPYSILYYTDEYSDRGKALRKVLAAFENEYDVDLYSIHAYYDSITSPIQIHQGSLDDAVPKEWSDELVNTLKDAEQDVTYYTYPGADHNLRPSWETVVARDISFFNQQLSL